MKSLLQILICSDSDLRLPSMQPFGYKCICSDVTEETILVFFQKVVPTTKNEKMGGRPFYVRDKGVYDLNDTYLTTTAKYHRRFKHKELDGVAKKDIPTYWETEEYPKAMTWGFGLHHK